MATAKVPIRFCIGHNIPLLKCSGDKKETEFYINWSPFSDGKTNLCKECCEKIFKYFIDKGLSERIAMYYTLQKLDMPFIKEIYESANNKTNKNGDKIPITVNSYISELHRIAIKKEIWDDFSATDVSNVSDLDSKIQDRESKEQELMRLEKTWGKQDEMSDYDFLEETFERYTADVEFTNPQQEDLYKDLCRDRLLLRKINDGRYGGEETLDKVQSRIAKTMSTLKLDQFESKKQLTLSEQSLFEKIRLCDENSVKDVYSEPSRHYDLNKVQYYNKKFSLRPLANMLVGHRDFDVSLDDIEQYDLK